MTLVVPFDEIFANEVGLLSRNPSWERVELGKVCKVVNGFPFKSTLFTKSDGFPIVRIRDLTTGRTETFVNGDVPPEALIDNGDLLIGMDGNFRCVEWQGGTAGLNQRVCKIIPDEQFMLRKFLLLGLNGYLKAIQDATSSVTVGHLSSRDILLIPFPLPPLAEQRRIVGKLELLLGKVSSSQQRLSRVPGLLKRFRQSVLAAGCSGKLTADWRESSAGFASPEDLKSDIAKFAATKPKREIERARKARSEVWPFDMGDEIPDSWLQANLIDVTRLITCGVAKRPEYVAKGIPFLSAQNAKPFNTNLNDIKYISEKDFRTFTVGGKPERDDVLYSRVGAKFGEAAKIPFDFDFAIYVSLTLIKPVREFVDPDFLVAFLNSHYGIRQAHGGILGSGIQNLNVENVRKYQIPLPPLAEQQEIVRRVEKLFAFADQIEARLKLAQSHFDRLTQSLLAKAFRGELVPTEHDLATAEGREYESASELLSRIRGTTGAETNGSRTKKRVSKGR